MNKKARRFAGNVFDNNFYTKLWIVIALILLESLRRVEWTVSWTEKVNLKIWSQVEVITSAWAGSMTWRERYAAYHSICIAEINVPELFSSFYHVSISSYCKKKTVGNVGRLIVGDLRRMTSGAKRDSITILMKFDIA